MSSSSSDIVTQSVRSSPFFRGDSLSSSHFFTQSLTQSVTYHLVKTFLIFAIQFSLSFSFILSFLHTIDTIGNFSQAPANKLQII